MSEHGSKIAVLAELERCGWAWEYGSETSYKVRCPFHDDQSPSGSVDIETGDFRCFTAGCGASGDFVQFLARVLKTNRATMIAELSTRYDFDEEKIVEGDQVERHHSRIWSAAPMLAELRKRGVSDESIRRWRLGEEKCREEYFSGSVHQVLAFCGKGAAEAPVGW